MSGRKKNVNIPMTCEFFSLVLTDNEDEMTISDECSFATNKTVSYFVVVLSSSVVMRNYCGHCLTLN